MNNTKIAACLLMAALIAATIPAPLSAQLSDEVGRLIEARGEVTIVTNDGITINAVNILESAKEQGVPIKLGNKIITDEYSSAVIQTMDNNVYRLEEMTTMQFGSAMNQEEKKAFSILKKVGSFFMRQSGKAGDYRTDLVNTGWDDININDESGNGDE